jgi:hypothetical protein
MTSAGAASAQPQNPSMITTATAAGTAARRTRPLSTRAAETMHSR